MKPTDSIEFSSLLDSVCALLTRGQYMPNETSTAIFFKALAEYPMEAVRGAFAEHVRRSRFSPTPADLLDLLVANDGRPGAEEAWTMAVRGQDEADTVVWTVETAAAFTACRPVLMSGDEVGARMAFKEVYGRTVADARQRGEPVQWQYMEGHDPARRQEALKVAMREGKLLPGTVELEALPPPRQTAALALPAPAAGESDLARAGRAALLAMANRLSSGGSAISSDAMAKLETTAARDEIAARVNAYAAEAGIDLSTAAIPQCQAESA